MELNDLVKKYYQLQSQADSIKKEMESVKSQIVEGTEKGEYEVEDNGVILVAKVFPKETIKYKDEIAMIKYLKEKGLTNYIEERIKTTDLNTQLKNRTGVLNEGMSNLFTINTNMALSVKAKK